MDRRQFLVCDAGSTADREVIAKIDMWCVESRRVLINELLVLYGLLDG